MPNRSGVPVVGEVDGQGDPPTVIDRVSPDVVLVDVQLADGDGFDVIDALPRERPWVRWLATSTRLPSSYRLRWR